jgi:hypothetical protein
VAGLLVVYRPVHLQPAGARAGEQGVAQAGLAGQGEDEGLDAGLAEPAPQEGGGRLVQAGGVDHHLRAEEGLGDELSQQRVLGDVGCAAPGDVGDDVENGLMVSGVADAADGADGGACPLCYNRSTSTSLSGSLVLRGSRQEGRSVTSDVTKHMESVQAAIGRMGSSSFLLKGWSVTLAAALFALAASQARIGFALAAFVPVLAFWGLDAYYLRKERLFRMLYDDLRSAPYAVTPFSMCTANYESKIDNWFWTLLTPSVVALHGVIVAVIAAVAIILQVRP